MNALLESFPRSSRQVWAALLEATASEMAALRVPSWSPSQPRKFHWGSAPSLDEEPPSMQPAVSAASLSCVVTAAPTIAAETATWSEPGLFVACISAATPARTDAVSAT